MRGGPHPGNMTWLASRILRALADTAEVVPSRCNANCSDAILAPPLSMITTLADAQSVPLLLGTPSLSMRIA